MRHRLILFPAFIALLGFSAQAMAAVASHLGSKDTIRFVANTGIKLENGNSMYLGRRITVSSFILPYNIQDNGYVLAVTNEPGNYSPLPTGPKLQTLQDNGFLPKPLPPFHLRAGDYLGGYALWWLLLVIFLLVSFIKKALERREYSEDEEP